MNLFNNTKKKENIIIFFFFLIFVLLIISTSLFVKPEYKKNNDYEMKAIYAVVKEISFDNTKGDFDRNKNEYKYQEFKILIKEGKYKGKSYWMRNTIETADVYNIILKENDKILVTITEDKNNNINNIHIYDRKRDYNIYLMLALFVFIIILIGKLQGFKSILSLVITGSLIIKVLLPMILSGYSPILITILLSIFIVSFTLILISGLNKKSIASILGTLSGVFISGIISLIVGYSSKITGLANEDTQQLVYLLNYPDINFKGILFAGIIIGSLGAVMDVSISISSSLYELKRIKPKIKRTELIKSGINIGKDIMGSMSNTLILAYTGGALELMLLFMASNMTFKEIINLDVVCVEIIRGLAGSIGLATTIPLTTIICAYFYKNNID